MESNLDTKPVISQNDYNKTILTIKKGLKHPKFGPSFSSFFQTPPTCLYNLYIRIYNFSAIFFQSPIVFGARRPKKKSHESPKVGGLEGTLRRFGQGLGVFSCMGSFRADTSPMPPSPPAMKFWMFPKIGVPQNGWFIENPIKMDDLGAPSVSCFVLTVLMNKKPPASLRRRRIKTSILYPVIWQERASLITSRGLIKKHFPWRVLCGIGRGVALDSHESSKR